MSVLWHRLQHSSIAFPRAAHTQPPFTTATIAIATIAYGATATITITTATIAIPKPSTFEYGGSHPAWTRLYL